MRGLCPSFVYFVRRRDGQGPVKIGYSRLPESRLAALTVWSPYPLEIVATIPGDYQLERRFHALFRHDHSHREWFEPSRQMEAVIAAIRRGEFDPAGLPPPRQLVRAKPRERTPVEREGSSIRSSYSHLFVRNGLRGTDQFEAALQNLDQLDGEARADAVRLLRTHLADPIRYGVTRPYPLAQAAFAAFCARRQKRAA